MAACAAGVYFGAVAVVAFEPPATGSLGALSADSVIDRIKEALSISADNELSAALNISRSNASTWRSRGKVPYSVAVMHPDQLWTSGVTAMVARPPC